MQAFTKHVGLVVPLNRAHIDTDQILPKQFLKRVERTGFGQFLFYDWRFTPDGQLNPDFELNQPRYAGASILLAGKNFGGGSSREHAPWALQDYGFKAVISSSFGDIFSNNCYKNGILPVRLEEDQVQELMKNIESTPGYQLTVDLESCTVFDSLGFTADFQVDPFRRFCLLNGLDDIGLTLQHADEISAYEDRHSVATQPHIRPGGK